MKFISYNEKSNSSQSIDSRLMSLNYNNLFLRNWYSGPDRFLNQDRVIVGIEHNQIDLKRDINLNLLFGKAFFLEDKYLLRRNNIGSSPLVLEFKNKLQGDFFSNGMIEIDSNFDKVYSSYLGVMFERGKNKKIELRSVYKRRNPYINHMPWLDKELPISQMELLTQWSVSDRFIVFGKLQKDNELNESKDFSFGLQYSNCCMKIGLMLSLIHI